MIDRAALQQALDPRRIDPVEDDGGGAMVEKGGGEETGAMRVGRHQEDAAAGAGHHRETRSLQQIGDRARAVRMNDRLRPSRRTGGEADASPGAGRHRRQGGERCRGNLLDFGHRDAERGKERCIGAAGDDAADAGKLKTVAALGFAKGRVERCFGRARQLDPCGSPHRRQAVAQACRHRLSRLYPRGEQTVRQPAGHRRQLREAQLGDAIAGAGQIGKGIGDRFEIVRPVDR